MSNEFDRTILDKEEFAQRESKEYYLSQKNLNFIKDTFKEKIKDSTLDLYELKKVLRNYGINLNKEDPLEKLLDNSEKRGKSEIDFDQFIDLITTKLDGIYSDQELSKFFSLIIGEENTDKIEFETLRRINKDLTDEEINELIQKTDTDKDNKINFEDFRDIIAKRI